MSFVIIMPACGQFNLNNIMNKAKQVTNNNAVNEATNVVNTVKDVNVNCQPAGLFHFFQDALPKPILCTAQELFNIIKNDLLTLQISAKLDINKLKQDHNAVQSKFPRFRNGGGLHLDCTDTQFIIYTSCAAWAQSLSSTAQLIQGTSFASNGVKDALGIAGSVISTIGGICQSILAGWQSCPSANTQQPSATNQQSLTSPIGGDQHRLNQILGPPKGGVQN